MAIILLMALHQQTVGGKCMAILPLMALHQHTVGGECMVIISLMALHQHIHNEQQGRHEQQAQCMQLHMIAITLLFIRKKRDVTDVIAAAKETMVNKEGSRRDVFA